MKAQGYITLPQATMLELMAYADGELEGEAKARIEELIATNAQARRLVQEMSKLGEVVERVYEAPEKSASDGIADAVMAKIADEAPKKPSVRPGKVISLSDAREKRIKIGAAIVAAIALAAGIVLTTQHANENGPVASPVKTITPAPVPPPTTANPPGQTQEALQVASGVDVEQVDSPTHEVEVFYLPSTKGNASSVVVWIDDKAGQGTP